MIVNRTLTFEVLALGNTFQHTMELKEKTLNKIILKVPSELGISNSLASYRKCLKIKSSNDDTIEVYDPVTKTWKIFTRRKRNVFFADVISHLFSVE